MNKILSLTKKDFEVSFFSGHGAGGQHRNKHKNCVRIRHAASGAMASNCTEKSLDKNKKLAFTRLCETKEFKLWLKMKVGEDINTQEELRKRVDELMKPENIKVEYYEPKV